MCCLVYKHAEEPEVALICIQEECMYDTDLASLHNMNKFLQNIYHSKIKAILCMFSNKIEFQKTHEDYEDSESAGMLCAH